MAKTGRVGSWKGVAAQRAWPRTVAASITSTTRRFLQYHQMTLEMRPVQPENDMQSQAQLAAYEGRVTNLHAVLNQGLGDVWKTLLQKARDGLAHKEELETKLRAAEEACHEAFLEFQGLSFEEQGRQASEHVTTPVLQLAAEASVHARRLQAEQVLKETQKLHSARCGEAPWMLESTLGGVLKAGRALLRDKYQYCIIPLLPALLGLPYAEDCECPCMAKMLRLAFCPVSCDEGKAAFQQLFCTQAAVLFPLRRSHFCQDSGRWVWPDSILASAGDIYDLWHELMVRYVT